MRVRSDTISVSSYPGAKFFTRRVVKQSSNILTIIIDYINYFLVNVLVLTIPIFIHNEWGDLFCDGHHFPV